MDPDTLFVMGLGIGVLSIPAVVSSITKGQRPRVATITLMIAGGMVVYAMSQKPGGYKLEAIPAIVSKVVNSFT
ncbi:hypothetical protein [Marivita sp. S2033]|uniref:hypothetical protein n=1 Tax=Marivita sp. S2033 TaxID=3373187 RepID=UPI003981E004